MFGDLFACFVCVLVMIAFGFDYLGARLSRLCVYVSFVCFCLGFWFVIWVAFYGWCLRGFACLLTCGCLWLTGLLLFVLFALV